MGDQVMAWAHTFQSGATGTGNGTAMSVGGLAGVGVQVEGISGDTVTLEGTIDGSTWYAIRAQNVTTGLVATAVTADGVYLVPVAGLDQLRARVSTYGAGTITVTGKGLTNPAVLGLALATANDGVDIGDVTINNAAGSGAYVQPGTSTTWPGSLALGVIALPTTLVYGHTTVTTAGTEVALGSSTALYSGVKIKALHANTGWIYVGLNGVTSSTGFVLDAGEEVFVEVANLATVFIDSSVNGEGVSYIGS